MKKVDFVDTKVKECRQKIKQTKKLIKKNEEDLQIISGEVKMNTKLKELTDDQKKKFA